LVLSISAKALAPIEPAITAITTMGSTWPVDIVMNPGKLFTTLLLTSDLFLLILLLWGAAA